MTDQEIKELVSLEVLRNIPDHAIQTILRRVIYHDNNQIDWQDFYQQIIEQMPELRLKEDSKIPNAL